MASNQIYNFLHSKGNHNHKQSKKNLWTGGKKNVCKSCDWQGINLQNLQTSHASRASLVAQTVKPQPAMWETGVWSLGQEGPLEKEWQPTPVFLPGEFHGQRSLVNSSPWGHRESDTTHQPKHTHTHTHTHTPTHCVVLCAWLRLSLPAPSPGTHPAWKEEKGKKFQNGYGSKC